jgi:hypothetical protein
MLIIHLLNTKVYAYDRLAVSFFSDANTETKADNEVGIYDHDNYYLYDQDCANYVSQCLIEGGIRFRSTYFVGRMRYDPDFDNDNTSTGLVNLLEKDNTGAYTAHIKNTDEVHYSRTVPLANDLFKSLTNNKHGGKMFNDKFENGKKIIDSWNLAKIGDVALLLHNDTNKYYHSVLIKKTIKDQDDFLYNAHDNWKKDYSMNLATNNQWKQNTTIIHLPDAPLIKDIFVTTGNDKSGYKQAKYFMKDEERAKGYYPTNHVGPYLCLGSGLNEVGKQNLVIEILFDTEVTTLSVSLVPTKSTGLPIMIFQKYPGLEYDVNGWNTNGNNKKWRGIINASSIPSGLHEDAQILISATAPDGSRSDKHNGLEIYEPGICESFYIALNTKLPNAGLKK